MAEQLIPADTQGFGFPPQVGDGPNRTGIEGRELLRPENLDWQGLERRKAEIREKLQRAEVSTEFGEERVAIKTEAQPLLQLRIGPVDVLAGGPEAHPLWRSWRAVAEEFSRIRVDPDVLGGEPRIAETRIQVSVLLAALSDGLGFADLLEEFPRLSTEDIQQALLFAARLTSI